MTVLVERGTRPKRFCSHDDQGPEWHHDFPYHLLLAFQ